VAGTPREPSLQDLSHCITDEYFRLWRLLSRHRARQDDNDETYANRRKKYHALNCDNVTFESSTKVRIPWDATLVRFLGAGVGD
jgi:hypothetical protein